MRFRNTLHVFIENFKNTYKILLFDLILLLVGGAALCALLLPGLLFIIYSPEWLAVADAITHIVFSLVPGHYNEMGAAITLLNEALPNFGAFLWTYFWEILGVAIGVLLLYLAVRFVESVFYYALGDTLDDRMQTYGEMTLTSSFVKNLSRAIRYSLVNVPVSFLLDVAMVVLCALALVFLNFIFGLFFAVLIAVLFQALKLTITCFWLPAMTTDRYMLKKALRISKEEAKGQFWKTFSVYVILIYCIMVVNVLAFLCTYGTALILTIPASSALLLSFQYVNYYTVLGKRYFITYDTISFNKDKGMSEQFFNHVLEEAEKEERKEKTGDASVELIEEKNNGQGQGE